MRAAGGFVVGLALMMPAAAGAQSLESMQRAMELGTVLASEELCGLTLDQAGIEAWIAANVGADDLAFAGNLRLMTDGQAFQLQGMSAAATTAHCAAVKRTAAAEGLIR